MLPAVGIIVLLMLTGALLFAATGSNEQTVVLPVGLPVGQLQTHQQDGAVEERLRPAVTAISAQATPAMSRDDYLKLRADLADIHQQLGAREAGEPGTQRSKNRRERERESKGSSAGTFFTASIRVKETESGMERQRNREPRNRETERHRQSRETERYRDRARQRRRNRTRR